MQPRFFTYSATPELGGGSQLAAAEPLAPNSNLRVRTTAYCHDESDHIAYGQLTALGTRLKYGAVRSAAADWSRFPVGTLFRIKDQPQILYQVDDYGSALVGTSTIDLYQPTRGLMNEWGVRHVDIEVLRWGSFARSQAIIRDRTRYPHVRRMFDDLSRRMYEVASAPTSSASATPYAAL
ncbi:MAG: 3D domain-containing protein [Verrucomicrobiales bacterium]|nr:3D domain-containing protein [Verrucomicrobiales bacterium]